jgi:CelD/BcsL family acetyltransferase involved in cellulose biosynthesis
MMRIEWLRELKEIEAKRDAWVALESQVRQRTLYCRYDYILPWYRCYSGTEHVDRGIPLVGFAWDGEMLVGVAPMIEARSTFARVPVKRADCAGYNLAAGEILVRDGVAGVIEAFVDALRDGLRFDLVNINGLDTDTPRQKELISHLERRGARYGLIDFHSYAIADLSKGYDAYIGAFGWKRRGRMKNIANKMTTQGEVKIERITSTGDRAFATSMRDRMLAISERSPRVQRAGVEVDRQHQPFYADLFEAFGPQGAIDLSILVINGEDAAFTFALVERGIYYHTMMAYAEIFEKISAGKYLFAEVIKMLPDLGLHMVLSHGGYEYKSRWASQIIPQQTVCVFGNTISGRLSHMVGFRFVHRRKAPAPGPPDEES